MLHGCSPLSMVEPMMPKDFIRRAMAVLAGERGQGMVEYALILVLIAVVVIVVLIILGNQVQNVFCNISGALGD